VQVFVHPSADRVPEPDVDEVTESALALRVRCPDLLEGSCLGGRVRTNFVLIDLENVRPENLGLLTGGQFKVKVFAGSQQKNVSIDMAQALQPFGAEAEYVRIQGHGKNALDFHIAYYIGRLAAESPGAFFHIISKDAGFDPLIRHLKSKKIYCLRWASIEDIPLVRLLHSKSLTDRVAAVVDFLSRRNAGRPKTLKTLSSAIGTLFQGGLSVEELEKILESLRKRGVVTEHGGKIAYALPESAS
jgi:hypothetical protein